MSHIFSSGIATRLLAKAIANTNRKTMTFIQLSSFEIRIYHYFLLIESNHKLSNNIKYQQYYPQQKIIEYDFSYAFKQSSCVYPHKYFQSASIEYNIKVQFSMSLTSLRKYRSQYSLELSDDEFSLSNKQLPHSSQKWANEFTELQVARDRFIAFASQLREQRNSQMREDIVAHCQHSSKKQRALQSLLTYEMVLNLVNQRIQKMVKNKRIKKNWSDQDVQILIWVISKYSDLHALNDVGRDIHREDWIAIASLIPGVHPQSCMFKWLSLKKNNLATNNWGQEESALLASIVKSSTGREGKRDAKDWKAISQRLYFQCPKPDKIYRNAKQCRQHWNCYLNPQLKKGPWKIEEDILLLKCIKENNGSKKWSEIVRYFNGRTQNALKNRYTLIVEKQKKQSKNRSQLEIVEEYLQKCYITQFTGEMNHNDSQQQLSNSLFSQQINNKRESEKSIDQAIIKEEVPNESMSTIKIKPIDFKSMTELNIEQLQYMQPGVLLNGVFQKTQDFDQNQLVSSSCFRLKKYKSSKF